MTAAAAAAKPAAAKPAAGAAIGAPWSGTLPADAIFPLDRSSWTGTSYKTSPLSFRSPREHTHGRITRVHAGVDLYGTTGVPIYAVAAGTLLQGPYLFAPAGKGFDANGYAVEVFHPGIGVVRYCEMLDGKTKVSKQIARGQLVGTMGKVLKAYSAMLHFEVYEFASFKDVPAQLTRKHANIFGRVDELCDPTPFVDALLQRGFKQA